MVAKLVGRAGERQGKKDATALVAGAADVAVVVDVGERGRCRGRCRGQMLWVDVVSLADVSQMSFPTERNNDNRRTERHNGTERNGTKMNTRRCVLMLVPVSRGRSSRVFRRTLNKNGAKI